MHSRICTIYKFHVKNIENYEPEEIRILKKINDREFYEEGLFWDVDFLWLDEIVYLYQTNKPAFYSLGINLRYYLEMMPKDIREEIEQDLKAKEEKKETERFIVNQIRNVLKQMEMNPLRLEKCKENEISEDIKDRMQFALEMKNIVIEREARGGFSKKEIGEIDFFLYKCENHKYIQLAMGENKVWGNFENQIKQLLGYANKNIEFGFTVVINIKDSQIKILEKFNINEQFQVIDIEDDDEVLVSVHHIPEENKEFKIYHFILNANTQERKNIAQDTRSKNKEDEVKQEDDKNYIKEKNSKEIMNSIQESIAKQIKYEQMTDILKKMQEVIYEEGFDEIIKKLKSLGSKARKKAMIEVDNKKYNNIQVFDEKDSPIMGFVEKIRKEKDEAIISMNIYKTIEQYEKLDKYNEKIVRTRFLKEALEIAQKKCKVLDLLVDKKIDIFNTGKESGEYKSYLYKNFTDEKFEIFIYSAEDGIYTLLRQIGLILNIILCKEDEIIPRSFVKINRNKAINVNLLERTKGERVIIFTDIFAVTMLKNTSLESSAPFLLQDEANKVFEEYFATEIMKKIEEKEG